MVQPQMGGERTRAMKALENDSQDRQTTAAAETLSLGLVLSGLVPPYEIDLDRLVWDPEYRDEIRSALQQPDHAA